MFETFRKLRVLVGPGQRGRWLIVVLLALVVSAFEAAGMLLVFVLLALLAEDAGEASLPLLGDVRGLLPGMDEAQLLLLVGVGVGIFFVVRAAAMIVQFYVQGRVVETAGARLSTRLLEGYLAMPATFHLQRNSAELVRNAFTAVQQVVEQGLVPVVYLAAKITMLAGITGVLLVISPIATLAAIVVLGPITWAMMRIVLPRIKRLGRTAQAMVRRNIQTLQQSLDGWRDIQMLGRERAFVREYARDRHRLARSQYLHRTASQVPRLGIETGVVVFIGGFVAVTVATQGGTAGTLPVLGLFGYAAVRLIPELNKITSSLNALKYVGPAIDDIYADLKDFEREAAAPADPAVPLALRDSLTVENVRYRYPAANTDALVEIDVEILAGRSIGIVGPTGGGKSTLVDVMLGLLEPVEGRVLVDGVDIRTTLRRWQASIGMVSQSIFLLDDTVRRNVALGVSDGEIDEQAVIEALAMSQLDEFVDGLPSGVDTFVGERGVRLSGGQRQRLAIARALYRRPKVLVFDEGTSALDNETEAALMGALDRLRGDRTIIIVAHRLSTVASCDHVLLVRDGRIADRGTYVELADRHVALRPSGV